MRKQVMILMISLLMLSGTFFNAGAVSPSASSSQGDNEVQHIAAGNRVRSGGGDVNGTANLPTGQATDPAPWPMAAANPARTSWTPEEVRGGLNPLWYKPIEPYIPQKVQIIAAYDTLYIATAGGLYALNAETGAERWVYATQFPLGHSPTVHNGVAYVGGLDRKLHAIDALTGTGLWTFEAGAGFVTNPLVVEGKVYAGSRDGYFYAIHAEGSNEGQLAWKYETDGPILYSAAYQEGVVFFASNDSHAYALNAETGALIWKSAKLSGGGFQSWWPVIYGERVIFTGNHNYRTADPDGGAHIPKLELDEIYPNHQTDPKGTLVGSLGTVSGGWVAGTPTIDAARILNYFAAKPWRKTVFILNRFTGVEEETAPVLWAGTHSGSRYPPVVGIDGVLYQQNNYMSDLWIAGGHIAGWSIGVPYISVVSSDWGAVDEPHAYSAGGNLIYWNLCCDRQAGAFDITIPNATFADRYYAGYRPPTGGSGGGREWSYFSYNLDTLIPGYNIRYYMSDTMPFAAFGGPNGVYGYHGDTNPPIPYKSKVYIHRGNAIISFGNPTGDPIALPMAVTVEAQDTDITPLGRDFLRAELASEIQKILTAGHLRPGYIGHGLFDSSGQHECGDDLVDYWHSSAETLYTLIQALPHLPSDLQQSTKSYLQSEFAAYPPYQYNHTGWAGTAREAFDLPPDIGLDSHLGPQSQNYTFKNAGGWNDQGVWGRNPYGFYALWKYAEIFGGAQTILNASQGAFWDEFNSQPADDVLLSMPHVHNAYIAGYLGYLELERLAETQESSPVRQELNRLLQLRATNFTKNSAYANKNKTSQEAYCRTLNVANNFMFLVPELAEYLRENALDKVQEAMNEYYELAPLWFVYTPEAGFGENAITPLYDSYAIFMAKALILEEPRDELENYLDVPAFARGDLYYIQKLVATIGNHGFTLSVTPPAHAVDAGGIATYNIQVQTSADFTHTVTLMAASPSPSLTLDLGPTAIASPGGQAELTLTDLHGGSQLSSGLWYRVPITATGGDITQTTSVGLLVGGVKLYLPAINKHN